MDGVHDMGGMDGFGKVTPEANEPVFHARWEGRVLGLSRAMGALGMWNIDASRYGIEVLPPHVYLGSSYYRRWFLRTENMLVAGGVVAADELAAGRALRGGQPNRQPNQKYTASDAARPMKRGSFTRAAQTAARFAPGAHVRARNIHPASHTRLPRYVRGHVGVVERIHGCHVFPDAAALGKGDDPQWLYTVVFDNRDLWGADADPTVKVSIDAFEPYLEPA
jgi:nitrile hydratase